MNKILTTIGVVVILIIVGFFIYQTISTLKEVSPEETATPIQQTETSTKSEVSSTDGGIPGITVEKALAGKNIIMVIAFRDFRDEEYFIPKEVFLAAGANVKTASNQKGTAIGANGGEAPVDLVVSEVDPANFDAVVFIGGSGALKNLDNEDSYNLAKETVSEGKFLAAICISPSILAKAGVLNGKKATVWTSSMDKSAVRILEENGATYQDSPVVVDGKIITASGPTAAEAFGMKVVEVLTNL